jgi:hypothetical protein
MIAREEIILQGENNTPTNSSFMTAISNDSPPPQICIYIGPLRSGRHSTFKRSLLHCFLFLVISILYQSTRYDIIPVSCPVCSASSCLKSCLFTPIYHAIHYHCFSTKHSGGLSIGCVVLHEYKYILSSILLFFSFLSFFFPPVPMIEKIVTFCCEVRCVHVLSEVVLEGWIG